MWFHWFTAAKGFIRFVRCQETFDAKTLTHIPLDACCHLDKKKFELDKKFSN
jgi:hypothetical protein